MKSKGKGEHIFKLFFVLFFIFIIGASLNYNPKARLIPLLVGVICLLMSLSLFISGILKKEKKGALSGEDELLQSIMKKVEVAEVEVKKKEKLSPEEKKKRFFEAVSWIIGFTLMIYLIGFLAAIPIFTIVFMRIKKESWLLSLSCGICLCVGVYFAFEKLSMTQLYEGIIFKLIGQ